MRPLKDKDFWAGLLFIFFGIGAILTAGENEMGTLSRMGPSYFPVIVGGLLTGLGALTSLRAFVTPERSVGGPAAQWGVVLFILGAVALFALTLLTFGLIAAVVILVLTASCANASCRIPEALILSAVLAFAAWAVFIGGLGLRIPVWPAVF